MSPLFHSGLWLVLACAVGGVPVSLSAQQSLPAELSTLSRIVIAVAGDVLPESPWRGTLDLEHFLDGVREESARADLAFVNLEEPITSSETVTPHKGPAELEAKRDYILRARNPAIPRALKAAGVGLVGLANNHILDYTEAGLRDTLHAFKESKLPVVGAGLKSEAERPFIFEKDGRRVALLAFSDVVPPRSWATKKRLGIASAKNHVNLAAAVRAARQQAEFVVLMIHWGGQGSHLITPRQRKLAKAAAEAGCAAVVGMHPHVLQGIEYVGAVPVFYSLGNFAVASSEAAFRETALVRLVFGLNELEAVELIPIEISWAGVPAVAAEARGKEILAHLDGFCRMFNSKVQEGKLLRSLPRAPFAYDTGATTAAVGASKPEGPEGARPGSTQTKGGSGPQKLPREDKD